MVWLFWMHRYPGANWLEYFLFGQTCSWYLQSRCFGLYVNLCRDTYWLGPYLYVQGSPPASRSSNDSCYRTRTSPLKSRANPIRRYWEGSEEQHLRYSKSLQNQKIWQHGHDRKKTGVPGKGLVPLKESAGSSIPVSLIRTFLNCPNYALPFFKDHFNSQLLSSLKW